jgi:hypothetical protein
MSRVDLASIIKKIAAMEAEEQFQAWKPRLSAMGHWERCLRQDCYHSQGYKPDKLSERSYLTMDDSSWHEELTFDWLRKGAVKVHSEQLEINKSGFTGHIDCLITLMNGETILVEHKAVNRYSFDRILKGYLPLDYITQVCHYLCSHELRALNVGSAILLMKCKDTARYLNFQVAYNHDKDSGMVELREEYSGNGELQWIIQGLFHKSWNEQSEIKVHKEFNTLPERPYRKGEDWQCDYCRYASYCWANYEYEVLGRDKRVECDAPLEEYFNVKRHVKSCEGDLKKIRNTIMGIADREQADVIACGNYHARITVTKKGSVNVRVYKNGEDDAETDE